MSSQPSCNDSRRGRLSRDERAKLVRKDRSRTSGRESGRRDHSEHCQTVRSRTSGRDLKQRGDFDSRQVARSRTSGRESDGGRKLILDKNSNRDKRGVNNNDNDKNERSPLRLNNNDRKREGQVEQINAFLWYFPKWVAINKDSHYIQQIGRIVNVLVVVYVYTSFDFTVEG